MSEFLYLPLPRAPHYSASKDTNVNYTIAEKSLSANHITHPRLSDESHDLAARKMNFQKNPTNGPRRECVCSTAGPNAATLLLSRNMADSVPVELRLVEKPYTGNIKVGYIEPLNAWASVTQIANNEIVEKSFVYPLAQAVDGRAGHRAISPIFAHRERRKKLDNGHSGHLSVTEAKQSSAKPRCLREAKSLHSRQPRNMAPKTNGNISTSALRRRAREARVSRGAEEQDKDSTDSNIIRNTKAEDSHRETGVAWETNNYRESAP
nr:hypothetical protein Iba_chr04bCG10850 [Ipomoea batatas]